MEFIGGLFFGLIISVVGYSIKIQKIIDDSKKWESQYECESKMYKPYKDNYYKLVLEYNKVVSLLEFYKRNSNDIHMDDDTKSALKFAMIQSHPDKGVCKGNDQFIKFKKVYDKYK